jgi:hypothetical protein
MAEPPIQMASGLDRPTQRDQILEIIQRAQQKHDLVRMRLPLALYNYGTSRGYTELRDASWNLQLPSENLQPEAIESIIAAVHLFIRTLAEVGATETMRRLLPLPEETTILEIPTVTDQEP